jgi:Putative esterase
MKKQRLFLLFLLINVGLFAQNIKTVSGTTQRFEDFKSKFVASRNVDVWLPEGYSAKNKYAVLYMHDGQMLFDSTTTWNHQEWGVDETLTKLAADKKIKNCIVVGIWNGGRSRHSEYFPQKPFESLPKPFQYSLMQQVKNNPQTAMFATNIQSDVYLKFLVTELKPFQTKVDAIMLKHGYDAAHWQTQEFLGDDHSEKSWSARLGIPMVFLLKR